MAKITLGENKGYALIPEGHYIFQIIEAKYDQKFGIMDLKYSTKEGYKSNERFSLIGNDGNVNEKAVNAFSYTSRVALNDFNVDEVESDDLIGKYFSVDITHETYIDKNGEPRTKARLNNKQPATGFETAATDKVDIDF